MNILALIYTIACIAQIIAGLPQINEIMRKRNSEELSLTTWSMWLLTQVFCFTYMVSTKNIVLMSMSALWLLYYGAMLGVIVYYRRRGSLLRTAEEVSS